MPKSGLYGAKINATYTDLRGWYPRQPQCQPSFTCPLKSIQKSAKVESVQNLSDGTKFLITFRCLNQTGFSEIRFQGVCHGQQWTYLPPGNSIPKKEVENRAHLDDIVILENVCLFANEKSVKEIDWSRFLFDPKENQDQKKTKQQKAEFKEWLARAQRDDKYNYRSKPYSKVFLDESEADWE